jgi:prolyl-tRNA synthetase
MGSYGIGVTRLVAAIAENSADDKGLVWPAEVAPFGIHLIATGKHDVAYELAERVATDLETAGFDVLYDDRPKVSPGVKFGDAELLGVPTIVIAGRGAGEGILELWDRRSGERTEVPAAELISRLG